MIMRAFTVGLQRRQRSLDDFALRASARSLSVILRADSVLNCAWLSFLTWYRIRQSNPYLRKKDCARERRSKFWLPVYWTDRALWKKEKISNADSKFQRKTKNPRVRFQIPTENSRVSGKKKKISVADSKFQRLKK